MKPSFRSLLPFLVCCLLAGCVQVDYFGQSFDPTPETSPVEYYTSREDIPAGKYRIIGRGTIATEMRVDGYDIREALVDTARKHGADAVATVSVTTVRVGVYPREENFDGSPTHSSHPEGINPSSAHAADDIFGSPTELKGERMARTETRVRALFLKNKAELEKALARRGKELDELVKQPDPKDVKSLKKEEPRKNEDVPDEKIELIRNTKSAK